MLEKKGLHQAAGILESYGIDSETDVSLLDRDDFYKLVSNGLKPMEGKKLDVKYPSRSNTTQFRNTECPDVISTFPHDDGIRVRQRQ